MEIEKYYNELDPNARIELFKKVYSLIETDSTIREDEDALESYCVMTVSCEKAIIQVNNFKEKCLNLEKENTLLKQENFQFGSRDSQFNEEIEKLKQKYELEIKELKETHYKKQQDLIQKSLSGQVSSSVLDTKITISNRVNNFVRVEIDKFEEFKKNIPLAQLRHAFESNSTSKDTLLRVFSFEMLKLIDNTKNYTQIIQKRIMEKIERELKKEDSEVLDDEFR